MGDSTLVKTLEDNIKILSQRVDSLQSIKLGLKQQEEDSSVKVRSLEEELAQLRREKGDLQIQNENLQIQNKNLQTRNETLNSKVMRLETEIQILVSKNANLKIENVNVRTENVELNEQFEERTRRMCERIIDEVKKAATAAQKNPAAGKPCNANATRWCLNGKKDSGGIPLETETPSTSTSSANQPSGDGDTNTMPSSGSDMGRRRSGSGPSSSKKLKSEADVNREGFYGQHTDSMITSTGTTSDSRDGQNMEGEQRLEEQFNNPTQPPLVPGVGDDYSSVALCGVSPIPKQCGSGSGIGYERPALGKRGRPKKGSTSSTTTSRPGGI